MIECTEWRKICIAHQWLDMKWDLLVGILSKNDRIEVNRFK